MAAPFIHQKGYRSGLEHTFVFINMTLTDSITKIKGIGEKTAKLMSKLNIFTVRDLLHTFPRDYDTFEGVCNISELAVGEQSIISGFIVIPPVFFYHSSFRVENQRIIKGTNVLEISF